jgi:hypothetical protein
MARTARGLNPTSIKVGQSDRLAPLRGFLFGLVLILVLVASVLSIRPGGLRRQLRLAARRFRLALLLGGVYLVGSAVVRLAFSQGVVSDFGPPVLALTLVAVFIVFGQDPAAPAER